MSLVFEKLTQTLAAGEVWRLTIAADFFRIAEAAWPVKVRILKAGRILGEMDGWQAGDFVRDVQFDAVEIEAGSLAQTVTVQIAGGGVGSDRVIGEVSVIDGAKARTMAGVAFAGYVSKAAVVDQYSYAQIWNPSASGKRVVVEAMETGSAVATLIYFAASTSAVVDYVSSATCKLIGSADSNAEFRSGASATDLTIGERLFAKVGPAGTSMYIKPKEPIVLEPGRGLVARAGGLNQDVFAHFEFFEESA